jgi:subtilisin family serine protease
MLTRQPIRQFANFEVDPALLDAYRKGPAALGEYLAPFRPGRLVEGDHVLPSLRARFIPGEGEPRVESVDAPGELIIPLQFDDAAALMLVRERLAANPPPFFLGIGADIAIAPTPYDSNWAPEQVADSIFGTRATASRLIEADYLRQQTTGAGVNIAVVDRGLDRASIGANWGGGWTAGGRRPGATVGGHGAMMVRNLLAIASSAKLFDCPVIPERITDIAAFLSDVLAAYNQMRADIAAWRAAGQHRGPWVFVNAWAIFDRKSEYPPGDYTNNPRHRFNNMMEQMTNDRFDLVFGAGNCGQFAPDKRCGPRDCGPGNSILGANSHPSVITVGAVRADGYWLGYSSQGPGQPNLETCKPDLCAPSQFCENRDAYMTNTGTSAATGLVAAVVAALRGRWDPNRVPPERLKQRLMDNARRFDNRRRDDRLGYGILDAKATYDAYP